MPIAAPHPPPHTHTARTHACWAPSCAGPPRSPAGPAASNTVSIIKLRELESILKGEYTKAPLPDFEQWKGFMSDSPHWPTPPFLFAGA